MTEATSRSIRRGFQPLRAHTDERAELAEEVRDQLLAAVDGLIALSRKVDPAMAAEFEQQRKLLRLRSGAEWWLARKHLSARALLRNP